MTRTQIPRQVIDEVMDVYVEWRDACIALRSAYERWSSVRVAERELPFASYRAALDWEERASAIYADRVEQVAEEFREEPLATAA
jgi:hypothetical protein